MLRQLGVFAASFDRRAAEQVVRLPDGEASVDDLLDQLAAISLLDHDLETDRFSLHDLVRVFAVEQLREQGEEPMTSLRYAAQYLDEARLAQDLFLQGGDNILRGLALFDTERPHIDAIGELARQQPNETSNGLLMAFAHATTHIGDLRYNKQRERILQIEAALEAARRQHDREAEGMFLGNLGLAYAALGNVQQAIPYYEQQLAIVRDIGDRRGEATGCWNLGRLLAQQGEGTRAIELIQVLVDFEREIGHADAEKHAAVVEALRQRLAEDDGDAT